MLEFLYLVLACDPFFVNVVRFFRCLHILRYRFWFKCLDNTLPLNFLFCPCMIWNLQYACGIARCSLTFVLSTKVSIKSLCIMFFNPRMFSCPSFNKIKSHISIPNQLIVTRKHPNWSYLHVSIIIFDILEWESLSLISFHCLLRHPQCMNFSLFSLSFNLFFFSIFPCQFAVVNIILTESKRCL